MAELVLLVSNGLVPDDLLIPLGKTSKDNAFASPLWVALVWDADKCFKLFCRVPKFVELAKEDVLRLTNDDFRQFLSFFRYPLDIKTVVPQLNQVGIDLFSLADQEGHNILFYWLADDLLSLEDASWVYQRQPQVLRKVIQDLRHHSQSRFAVPPARLAQLEKIMLVNDVPQGGTIPTKLHL